MWLLSTVADSAERTLEQLKLFGPCYSRVFIDYLKSHLKKKKVIFNKLLAILFLLLICQCQNSINFFFLLLNIKQLLHQYEI